MEPVKQKTINAADKKTDDRHKHAGPGKHSVHSDHNGGHGRQHSDHNGGHGRQHSNHNGGHGRQHSDHINIGIVVGSGTDILRQKQPTSYLSIQIR